MASKKAITNIAVKTSAQIIKQTINIIRKTFIPQNKQKKRNKQEKKINFFFLKIEF